MSICFTLFLLVKQTDCTLGLRLLIRDYGCIIMQTNEYWSFTCSIYRHFKWSYLIKAAHHTSHMFVFHHHSLLFMTNLCKDTRILMLNCIKWMNTLWCCAKPPSSIGPLIRVFIKCQLHLFPSVLIIKTQGSSCVQKGAKSNEVNSLPGSSGTGAEVGLSCCSYTYPLCTAAWPLYPPLLCLLAMSMFPVFNINCVIFSTQLWSLHLGF